MEGGRENKETGEVPVRAMAVEDDPVLRRGYERFFAPNAQGMGFDRFVVYPNGMTALDAFKGANPPFNLVIVDGNMPGMSGIELAQLLRGLKPELVIALASSHSKDSLPDDQRRLFDLFWTKPFGSEMGTFVSQARTIVSQRQSL